MPGKHEGEEKHTYEDIDISGAGKDPDGKPQGGGRHEGDDAQ
ncbi:hypothetical protein AB0F17_53785 [Nonomuraea sp. NPDC026600]